MKRGLSPAFIDLFALMVVLFLLLPHRPETATESDAQMDALVVRAEWCDLCRTDVDMWLRAPGGRPVGYANKQGRYISLERDDLGHDKFPLRYEQAKARIVPDGEWIINLHLYNDAGANRPITVAVEVWFRPEGQKRHDLIFEDDAVLERVGQELTVVRFRTHAGDFVPGSVHHSPIALRARNQGGGP